MDIGPIAVYYYQASSGRCPFKEWLDSLDQDVQQVIDARLTRVRRGLLGNAKNLGGGLWELKFDVGPGYRIYYGRAGKAVVILLNAGHKKEQSGDIEAAREYWADYLRRTRQ
ncbi:MAG: type II toxin-antitoxin system RelE/ParE family toxin [Elusimicrobia bacterium]|nr:type II toxin-antitoxin system RelE/ParE family toxin [Elusimicrobiota bacterium]